MVSSIVYSGDGTTRIFPVDFKILGDNFVRVYIDGVEVTDKRKYDIINNSIVFNEEETPPIGEGNVQIYVATSESELGDLGAPLTDITIVAQNIADINAVGQQVVPNLPEILQADDNAIIATQKALEASNSATSASESATIASTKAGEASTSANNASTSEANALAYRDTASTHATTATTQAGIATTKAEEASASASASLTSRNQAETFAQQAQLSAESVDADNLVHKTGDETIAGTKTFTSSPIVPAPTTNTQAANKAYIDTQITGLGTAATRDVGTSAGNVMEVGAFGVGNGLPPLGTITTSVTVTNIEVPRSETLNDSSPAIIWLGKDRVSNTSIDVIQYNARFILTCVAGASDASNAIVDVVFHPGTNYNGQLSVISHGQSSFLHQKLRIKPVRVPDPEGVTDCYMYGLYINITDEYLKVTMSGDYRVYRPLSRQYPFISNELTYGAWEDVPDAENDIDALRFNQYGICHTGNIKTALNATGTAPIYACRAWVNFNGTGTVAIRASGNVSSITDNRIGDYTVNFTTAMPDTNYSVAGSVQRNQDGSADGNFASIKRSTTYNSLLSTSARVQAGDTAGALQDPLVCCILIFR
jgi:hypothetical protein